MSKNETFGKQKDFRKFVMFFPLSKVQGKRKIKIMKKIIANHVISIRERSLMTSHIRVGRGVQDSPQKGTL